MMYADLLRIDLMSAIPRMRYEKLLANYVATPEILFYFSALKSR